jgi:hypothetical protein
VGGAQGLFTFLYLSLAVFSFSFSPHLEYQLEYSLYCSPASFSECAP